METKEKSRRELVEGVIVARLNEMQLAHKKANGQIQVGLPGRPAIVVTDDAIAVAIGGDKLLLGPADEETVTRAIEIVEIFAEIGKMALNDVTTTVKMNSAAAKSLVAKTAKEVGERQGWAVLTESAKGVHHLTLRGQVIGTVADVVITPQGVMCQHGDDTCLLDEAIEDIISSVI